MGDGDKP